MLGRNGNTAYVRYNSQGRIVAGGPIISPIRPKNGNWIAVSNVLGTNTTGTNGNILRAFIRLDMFGRVVPSSLVIQTKEPLDANSGTGWIELNAIYRGSGTTTTTTSSSSSTTTTTTSSTTSTTTTANPYFRYSYFTQQGDQQWFFKDAYSGIYQNVFCNPINLWFSNNPIGIGTRVYYDSAQTIPLNQPYTAWITVSTTSVNCLNVPGTLPVYTVDTNGYITDISQTVDDISYRLYVETTGGSWYNTLNPFTTDCTQYFNTAITAPTVNSISIGTTVYSSLAPATHDPNLALLAYGGNIYSVAAGGIVTSLLTNCGGTTTTTTTTVAASPLILTFNIANDGDSLTLPFTGGPSNTVYWGDSSSSLTNTHTYATAGNYDVTIYGTSPGFNFFTYGDATSRGQLRDVKQWGTFLQPGDWSLLFNQCGNLTGVSATDSPSFGSETNLSYMFGSCTSLGTTTTNISSWNVSGIVNMNNMFNSASSFNSNIGNWNTSNVTDMSNMFTGANAFNQNIGSWDVSNVTNMTGMFQLASSFNQSLNSWDVSSVTSMYGMFTSNSGFNGNISSWNVSNVTDMTTMFNGCSSFNQDISNWDVSNVTGMNFMFRLCGSFNQDLSGWCVTNIPSEPFLFSQNTFSWSLPKPVWGTCPS